MSYCFDHITLYTLEERKKIIQQTLYKGNLWKFRHSVTNKEEEGRGRIGKVTMVSEKGANKKNNTRWDDFLICDISLWSLDACYAVFLSSSL